MVCFMGLLQPLALVIACLSPPALASLDAIVKIVGGGASFPELVYSDASFNYKVTNGAEVTYQGSGSTTGKCNIMGYVWLIFCFSSLLSFGCRAEAHVSLPHSALLLLGS